jgi:hypothetical protein
MEGMISKKGKNVPSKEEIDRMSDAEKMAMAMKLQKEMGFGGPLQVKDTAAFADCIKLNNELAKLGGDLSVAARIGDIHKRHGDTHDKIDADTSAAIKTCPEISTGEMSARDEKCVKAKELAGADRHIAEANNELADLRNVLAAHAARLRPMVNRADALLARVKFGAGMDNQSLTVYNQMQGQVLAQIMILQGYIMEAYTDAAEWVQKKKNIQK